MVLVSPRIRQVDSVLVSLYWMLVRALDHFKNLLYVFVTHCYILVPGKPRNSRPTCDRGSNTLVFLSTHIGILKLTFKYGSLNMDQAEGRLEVHTSPYLNSGYFVKNAWTNPYKGLRRPSLCSEMVFALGINTLIGVNSRKTTWSVQGGFEVAAVCIYTVLYKCTLQGASHTTHMRQRSK